MKSKIRFSSRIIGGLAILAFLSFAGKDGFAMNLNLATPYSDICSPPHNPYLSFHSPASENLMFDEGDVIAIRCRAGLRAIGLRWSLRRNTVRTPFLEGTAEAMPNNSFSIHIPTDGLHPGFYDLHVELDTGMSNNERAPLAARPVKGVSTFGWKVNEMVIADSRPADFADFWQKAKAGIDAVPLDVREGEPIIFDNEAINAYNLAYAALPEAYDPTGHQADHVESFKVDFAGPDGGRVYGWLAKPAGEGPFPAMLILPGAGYAARPRPLEHARHGYVALDIQVHGQDVDLDAYSVPEGAEEGNRAISPLEHYYYNVHLRCLQAVNYLASRPDVDSSRIVVVGGSQGGRLGAVVAGIDQRIAAAVLAISHFANQPYANWAVGLNRSQDHGMGQDHTATVEVTDMATCLAYYDPMNFAPDIRCPVLMNAGLIDHVSPPSAVFAVFNRLGTENKTIVALDGLGHDWSAEFDRAAWRWLDAQLRRAGPIETRQRQQL